MPSLSLEKELLNAVQGERKVNCATLDKHPRHSYGQIFKSSMLIGASTFLNVGLSALRNKAAALILGPAGFGLMGLYSSILDLAQSVAGMGINSSGVRQIAEAVGSGETHRVARTATVLRRAAVLLGIIGAALVVVFSRQLSNMTFGTPQHRGSVALLALAVLFGAIMGGRSALLQGLRRIKDLALMSVVGTVLGTISSICLIYFLRENGLALALVASAAATLLAAWWISRRIQLETVIMARTEAVKEAAALLKLGFAFMCSGLFTMGAAYAIRIMIRQTIGFGAAGCYQSAWSIGGLYVGFILQAMAADFYPRLTGVSKDNIECTRLVNEQAAISLLLAAPGVLGTLTFAPLVISLFYSTKFAAAVPVLRWICLGMALRVIAWPMGFIVLAKGAQKVFFWTEAAATGVHVGLAWLFIKVFALPGAGVAFFGMYVWHGLLIYFIVRRMSGFRWSTMNRKIGMLFLPLTAVVFVGFCVLPFWLATAIGALTTLLVGAYSLRLLLRLTCQGQAPQVVSRLLARFGLGSGEANREE